MIYYAMIKDANNKKYFRIIKAVSFINAIDKIDRYCFRQGIEVKSHVIKTEAFDSESLYTPIIVR